MSSATANPLVLFIRSEPGMAERLLAQHVDDGSGRCAVCTAGNQTGRLTWPCQTRLAADAARQPPPRFPHGEDAIRTMADPT